MKRQKTREFLMFSVSKRMEHWREHGVNHVHGSDILLLFCHKAQNYKMGVSVTIFWKFLTIQVFFSLIKT